MIGCSAPAPAGEPHPCTMRPTQVDRTLCLADALKAADVDLNQVYRTLNDRLDTNGKRNLVAAERAWIAFRDRECDLRTGYDTVDLANNGTLAPYLVGDCRLGLTRARTTELRRQLTCPGGDLSCAP
nr:DUF1311 domain-containing protein [Methylobacterium goesingense]